MKVDGRPYRSIWLAPGGEAVEIIDQTRLPHDFVVARLTTLEDAAAAIRDMQVRGAPLIGVTAVYGLYLALRGGEAGDGALERAASLLGATRPTAVNLAAALARARTELERLAPSERARGALALAEALADADVADNRAIGEHGLSLLRALPRRHPDRPLQIMTHCNAGWLATVDFGTALSPIYLAHEAGESLHVWVSETRPRNQGAYLTAWELGKAGVPHTLVVDNAAGHLLRRGDVDLVIVGTDRTTAAGDVANKVGTYLKAVAARDCGVPFYVAAPSFSIDWELDDGGAIPIEERSPAEVTHIAGLLEGAGWGTVRVAPGGTPARNFGFDVTPARLVTGLITERGICEASREGLRRLFPDKRPLDTDRPS